MGNSPKLTLGEERPPQVPALVPIPLLPLPGACECGGSWNPKPPSWQCHLLWGTTATAWPSSPRWPSSLWTSTCTAGNRERSSSLPEKRWNCYPWTWDSSAELHWERQQAVFLSVNWYKSCFLSLGGQIRGLDTFSMTEITGGGLRIIRKAARPHLSLDKPRREDAQTLWSFCLLRDFELSLFCW